MRVTDYLSLPLNFSGIIRLRQSLETAFGLIDQWGKTAYMISKPKFVSSAATSITLTKADHFDAGDTDSTATGAVAREGILYTTSGSAVAAGMTKTESDKVPIGTKLYLVQSAGAVTITGSGGVTFTARGVVAGGRTALAVKVTASLWLVDYPALSA